MTLAELNGHLDMLTQLQEAKESLSNMQAKIFAWNEQSCAHCRKEMLTHMIFHEKD